MSGQILVPLKKHDLIEEITPYVEQFAQPKSRVVFLIHYSGDGFADLRTCLTVMQTEIRHITMARHRTETFILKRQRQRAEAKVFAARQLLKSKGVDVAVVLYSGSLRGAVKDHIKRQETQLIVMPAARHRFLHLLSGLVGFLGPYKERRKPAMVVLR